MSHRERGRGRTVLPLLLASGIFGFLALGAFRTGPDPSISIEPQKPAIGRRTPIDVKVSEPRRGLVHVRVDLVQGDRAVALAEKRYTHRAPWALWGRRDESDTLRVEAGRDTVKGLKHGEARIRVTADRAPSWLRHPGPEIRDVVLPVRLVPPAVQILSMQTYAEQGGCEAVVYRAGETAVRHGVRAGSWFFPGFPLPGSGPGTHFALFAVPYDLSDVSQVRLVAADDVDNESQVAFVDKFFPQRLQTDTIRLDGAFLSRVVPAILSHTPDHEDRGDPLENFLAVNGELRRKNNAELVELAKRSKQRFLWSRPFLPMGSSQVMARFADRRTYVYEGRVVDHQDHLGLDMARTALAPVPVANNGAVVLARYFGIYGNAVVVDHGYGLMSLYGHLSSVDVKEGQEVKRGEILGRTGDTGLAGGDHLHFAILLQGLPVTPIEWWDAHWLRDRLVRKLGSALRLEE